MSIYTFICIVSCLTNVVQITYHIQELEFNFNLGWSVLLSMSQVRSLYENYGFCFTCCLLGHAKKFAYINKRNSTIA